MAWDHLAVNKPHVVYIVLGGFTSLFMLCSTIIKERMYIGEATVATLVGIIFGPHAADLINPFSWGGSTDQITLEFSRIVLVVQCFAVGVELPKFYMEKHWRSVTYLLVPVMAYGWLITSVFIWWMVPVLSWLESLAVAACVTATDPVLASSVVGKGKFARRVPKHLRDLLSAESGCNDGMAFPFIYLALYLIIDHQDAKKASFHWLVYTILYECVFGAVYGFLLGYIARHGIKYSEKHDLIDRESFLVFYFVLALFAAGSGSILGIDDLLVGFAAGVGFSNDGWFTQKTEESHVSNVIDLLLNLTYFVYLGTIIPWEMFNDLSIGLSAWRLSVIAILVIFFRRIPIMLALKPLIPDIKTWREALFAGHFGPIGVGAIFVAILARLELEGVDATPLPQDELPGAGTPYHNLILLIWPIVTFMVIASIVVHGSSIAVFTLGKHINTLTITMSYTQGNEDGPSWMNRLPRISSQSRSQAKSYASDTDMPDYPPGTLPPVSMRGQLLRRMRDEDGGRFGSRASSLVSRHRRKKWDTGIGPGGPISESAFGPPPRAQNDVNHSMTSSDRQDSGKTVVAESGAETSKQRKEKEKDPENYGGLFEESPEQSPSPGRRPSGEGRLEVYEEGRDIIIENQDGDVLAVTRTRSQDRPAAPDEHGVSLEPASKEEISESKSDEPSFWSISSMKKRFDEWKNEEIQKRKEKARAERKHEPARMFQFGNTIIVEDENGEVLKKWDLPQDKDGGQDLLTQGLKYMGMGALVKGSQSQPGEGAGPSTQPGAASGAEVTKTNSGPRWGSIFGLGALTGEGAAERARRKSIVEEKEEQDDKHIWFKLEGVDRRLTKNDFIKLVQQMDPQKRLEVIDTSSASNAVKSLARMDPPKSAKKVEQAAESAAGPEEHGRDSYDGEASSSQQTRSTSRSPSSSGPRKADPGDDQPSSSIPETAAERRRRMSVLQNVDDDAAETPAERRRREAALGVGSSGQTADDSDDDDTPRVPPARRGIRFADNIERGRR